MAHTNKLSLCECGNTVLEPYVPIGTQFELDFEIHGPGFLICGRCQRQHRIHLIMARKTFTVTKGLLPLEIFDVYDDIFRKAQRQ
jgi:hypothetical protein